MRHYKYLRDKESKLRMCWKKHSCDSQISVILLSTVSQMRLYISKMRTGCEKHGIFIVLQRLLLLLLLLLLLFYAIFFTFNGQASWRRYRKR